MSGSECRDGPPILLRRQFAQNRLIRGCQGPSRLGRQVFQRLLHPPPKGDPRPGRILNQGLKRQILIQQRADASPVAALDELRQPAELPAGYRVGGKQWIAAHRELAQFLAVPALVSPDIHIVRRLRRHDTLEDLPVDLQGLIRPVVSKECIGIIEKRVDPRRCRPKLLRDGLGPELGSFEMPQAPAVHLGQTSGQFRAFGMPGRQESDGFLQGLSLQMVRFRCSVSVRLADQ